VLRQDRDRSHHEFLEWFGHLYHAFLEWLDRSYHAFRGCFLPEVGVAV
jgi:hypothetical protein